MKKLILLLLISTFSYGQAEFERIKITENVATAATSKIVSQQPDTGELNYIDAVNLPFPKTALPYGVDFDPLLSQDLSDLTVKKRVLQPETAKIDPAIIPIYAWGDSLTAGFSVTPYPTQLATLLGYPVTNNGVGGETSTQIRIRMIADVANYSKSVIIWAGRNNFSNPTTVKADIATMVAALGHTRYLVLSLLNSANGGVGTTQYAEIASLNSDLKAIYGSKYVPIREVIVNAYNPNLSQDVIDHANDVPPESLRITGDALHLNSAGYAVVAAELYKRLGLLYNQNGYLQLKDLSGNAILNQNSSVQNARFNATTGQLNPTDASGAVVVRNARASDASTVQEWKNISGTVTASVTGVGNISGNSLIKNPATAFTPYSTVATGSIVLGARGATGGVPMIASSTASTTTTGMLHASIQASNSVRTAEADMMFMTGYRTGDVLDGVTASGVAFNFRNSASDMFYIFRDGNVQINVSGAASGANRGYGFDNKRSTMLELGVTLGTRPTTSASTYDILTRDITTGVVEKIVSSSVAPVASPTFTGTVTAPVLNISGQTASTIAILDASKNVTSASTAVYPSLTELSYNKGVTSPIQTQINSKADINNTTLTGTSSVPTPTTSTGIANKSYVDTAISTAVTGKKSFIYNFDHIELTNTSGTYFMKPLTGLVYSDNKSTSDYTVLKTLTWNKVAFIAPYKCRLKKASFGTNGGVYLYVGGVLATVKSDLYNGYNGGTSFVVDNVNITVEADTLIYLAFRTTSTGQNIMEGTLYFEEF